LTFTTDVGKQLPITVSTTIPRHSEMKDSQNAQQQITISLDNSSK